MSRISDLYRKSIEEQVVTEPIEEQVVTEPIEEQVVTEPIEEQVVTEPIEEPVVTEPIEERPVGTEPIEERPVVTEPIEEPVVTEPIEERPVGTESLLEKLGVEKTKLNSDNVDILFIASHIPQFIQMLEKASTITVNINSDSITFNLDNNEVTISKTNWTLNGETQPICFNASWFLKQDDKRTAEVLHNNAHAAERFCNFIREIAKTNARLTDYVDTTLGDIDNDSFVVYRKELPCAVFYTDHEGRKVKLVA